MNMGDGIRIRSIMPVICLKGGFDSMEKLLEVRHLKKYFPVKKGFIKRTVGSVKATDDVTFDIYKGELLGFVGESGCGKQRWAN